MRKKGIERIKFSWYYELPLNKYEQRFWYRFAHTAWFTVNNEEGD
jgi:hypothetical protein